MRQGLAGLWLGIVLTCSAQAASVPSDDALLVPIGSWRVSTVDEDGSARSGLLVVQEADDISGEGYVRWPAAGPRGEVLERCHIVRVPDEDGVYISCHRADSVGEARIPQLFMTTAPLLARGRTDALVESQWPGSRSRPCTLQWASSRLPAEAADITIGVFEKTGWQWLLQLLSNRYRIEGTMVWPYPEVVMLNSLQQFEDVQIRDLADRCATVHQLRRTILDQLDFTELVKDFGDELEDIALRRVIDEWFGEFEGDLRELAEEVASPGGAIAEGYDRQVQAYLLNVTMRAAQQQIRRRLRGALEARISTESDVHPSFEIGSHAELDEVVLTLSNPTSQVLRDVVVLCDIAMDVGAVDDYVGRIFARNAGFPAPSAVRDKARQQTLGMGLVQAATAGTMVHIDHWAPGVRIEIYTETMLLPFMEFARSGQLWVNCAEGSWEVPLDLEALREPIREWDRAGRPAREIPTRGAPYRFVEPTNR